MAKQTVDTGTVANDGTGDNTRDSFIKLNENFDEVYISLDEVNDGLDASNTDLNAALAALDAALDADIVNLNTHVTDAAIHYAQGAISITESQISDLQSYALSVHSHNILPIPSVLYGQVDDIKGMIAVDSTSLYYCFQNWDATVVSAGVMVNLIQYEIVDPGTTDFTLAGAADNNVGTVFTATGIAVGTGTARELVDIWVEINDAAIETQRVDYDAHIVDYDAHVITYDAHVADGTLHFTEASIDHVNIANSGVNTHAQIDTHINNAAAHIVPVPTLPHGVAGDIDGMIAIEAGYVYFCTADYVDDATIIWKRIALPAPTNATTW